MEWVYHRTSKYVTPHFIVDGDVDFIMNHIWETSTSLLEEDKANPDFIVTKADRLCLDPGGMLHMEIPFKDITIDGYRFTVQLCSAERILRLMALGEERIPGYMRFPVWGNWCNILVVAPVGIFRALQEKLRELMMSDEALHANLKDNEAKAQIRKKFGRLKENESNF